MLLNNKREKEQLFKRVGPIAATQNKKRAIGAYAGKALAWLGAERKIVLATLVTALSTLAFISVAEVTMEGKTSLVDETILKALRVSGDLHQPIGPSWMLSTAQDISALGGVPVLVLLTTFVCGYFLLKRKLRTMLFMLICVLGGTALNFGLKMFFNRPRPFIVPHLVAVGGLAFPSGHSMISAIVYLTIAAILARSTTSRLLKVYYVVIGSFLAFIIGLSRIYLGVHYPTDVLAGWCAGVAFAACAYTVTAWMQRRGSVEKEGSVSKNANTGPPA